MSFVKAKEYLKQYGLENKIMEFPVSSATVEEAAKALFSRVNNAVDSIQQYTKSDTETI